MQDLTETGVDESAESVLEEDEGEQPHDLHICLGHCASKSLSHWWRCTWHICAALRGIFAAEHV